MPAGTVTKSALIPVGDMSLQARQDSRAECERICLQNAIDIKIKTRQEDLILRDVLPGTDLGVAAAGGIALPVQEDWLIAGAGAVGVEVQYISITVAIDRVIGFFGLSLETVPASISRVRLTLGPASSEIRGVYDTQGLNARLETVGYFTEPVIYLRNDVMRVMVMPRLAWAVNTQRLMLLGRTCEPRGLVVSAPSV